MEWMTKPSIQVGYGARLVFHMVKGDATVNVSESCTTMLILI